jgi:hypothetical protein
MMIALISHGTLKARHFPLPDSAPAPFVLRSVEDADRLIAVAERDKTAVMIGASFISMEVASALRERGLAVTIVNKDKIPLVKQLGPQMGQLILEKHLKKGVRFLSETGSDNFWTYHYGVRYEFFGQIPEHTELFIEGDLDQPKFVAAYLGDGRCRAFFAANRETETACLLDYMEREGSPSLQTFRAILSAAQAEASIKADNSK